MLALSLFALQTTPLRGTYGRRVQFVQCGFEKDQSRLAISDRYDFTGFMPYLFALVCSLCLFGLVMSIFAWTGALSTGAFKVLRLARIRVCPHAVLFLFALSLSLSLSSFFTSLRLSCHVHKEHDLCWSWRDNLLVLHHLRYPVDCGREAQQVQAGRFSPILRGHACFT